MENHRGFIEAFGKLFDKPFVGKPIACKSWQSWQMTTVFFTGIRLETFEVCTF